MFSNFAVSFASSYCGNFIDVSVTNPMCTAINYVKDRNIFGGYGSGEFGINGNINRAEVLTVVLRSFLDGDFEVGLTPKTDGSELGFKDTPSGTSDWWFYNVKRGKELGFISGYKDGFFRGGANVSRAEFLKMFVYASPYGQSIIQWPVNSYYLYEDTLFDAWYAGVISFANQKGLLKGLNFCAYNKFCPNTAITRGEVAQVIYNYKKSFNKDIGFLKQGMYLMRYNGGYSGAYILSDLPGNAIAAFKVPSRVFDSQESAKKLKNIDCSKPTPSEYTDSISYLKNSGVTSWIYFYTTNSNWKSGGKADFYISSWIKSNPNVYGPFNDYLQKFLEDIVAVRCLDGTFGAANYSDIPADPT